MANKPLLRCPTCRTLVPVESEEAPFCSDRCRRIDLGKWASGDYKISSPILDPDLLEELEHKQQQENPFAAELRRDWKN